MDASEKPKQKTSRMRKADRKRQLMQHAKELFVTLGYQHTTTEKIAQAAGVTEPVLYRHFSSKKTLFLEVLDDIRLNDDPPLAKRHGQDRRSVATAARHRRSVPGQHPRARPGISASCTAAWSRPTMRKSRRACATFYLDSERMLAQVIGEGQQTGVFRADLDPRVGAWELIRTALGYTLTLPLAIPLYQEKGYTAKAIECMMGCSAPSPGMRKTSTSRRVSRVLSEG